MKLLVSLLFHLLLSASLVEASVTIISVTGSSNTANDSSNTTPIIYGGYSGTNCTGNDNTNTCDSCEANANKIAACNTRRIYDDLVLSITFKVETLPDGTSGEAHAESASNTGNDVQALSGSSTSVSQGEAATLNIKWSDLCSVLAGNGSCETASFSETLTLGIDQDGDSLLSSDEGGSVRIIVNSPDAPSDTIDLCASALPTDSGICDFNAIPGDEKFIFKEDGIVMTDLFPNALKLNFNQVVAFYSETGFSDANTVSLLQRSINLTSVDDEYELQNNVVDGLTNGVFYFIRVGVRDEANNIAFLTSNNAIVTKCGLSSITDYDVTDPSEAQDKACDFIAKPDPVLGFLKEDVNCFIATAAYGSPMAEKVTNFRAFRDQFLLKSSYGRLFVKLYYKYSPPLARLIVQNDILRATVRLFLWPFWALAMLALNLPSGVFPVILFLFLSLLFSLTALYFKRAHYDK